ncbi:MAG: hypothetical protein J2P36_16100, partial [Ktedonobacteraceae bacterium]|nr:hypothetical protein [Ktedonobacteraceae bacterium]
KGVPTLVQVRKSNNGLLIMVSLLTIMMAIGSIGSSSAPFLSLLSGQGPLQHMFKLYFNGGEAASNASVLDSALLGLSLLALLLGLTAMFFPPGGLVLAGAEIASEEAAAMVISGAERGAVQAGVGALIAYAGAHTPGGTSEDEPPSVKSHADPSQLEDIGLRRTGEKASNAVNDHLKPDDLKGAWRDLHGNPVPHPNGGYWNHLDEVNIAQDSIRNMINRYKENLVKNPNLSSNDRAIMQDMISKGSKTLEYIKKVMGRDEWVDGTQIPPW